MNSKSFHISKKIHCIKTAICPISTLVFSDQFETRFSFNAALQKKFRCSRENFMKKFGYLYTKKQNHSQSGHRAKDDKIPITLSVTGFQQ